MAKIDPNHPADPQLIPGVAGQPRLRRHLAADDTAYQTTNLGSNTTLVAVLT